MKPAYTTIIHTSGSKRYYSFLPPHRIELQPYQSITYVGSIEDRLIPGYPYHTDKDRKPNRTKLAALNKTVKDGTFQIVYSDSPIIHSAMTKAFRKVTTLGQVDPNYINKR